MGETNKIIKIVDVITRDFIPFRGAKLIGHPLDNARIASFCDSSENVKVFAREIRNENHILAFVVLSLGADQKDLPKRIRNIVDLRSRRNAESTIDIPDSSTIHFYIIGEEDLIVKNKIIKTIDTLNRDGEGRLTYKLYPMRNFIVNIPECAAVPKFRLMNEEEVTTALRLAHLSRQKLPTVNDSDVAVVWCGGKIGDCVMYERYTPNAGITHVIRRVVKTPATAKNAGDTEEGQAPDGDEDGAE